MLFVFIFSSLFVLIISFIIAYTAKKEVNNDHDPIKYLFGNNSTLLATSSNIGSILTMTLLITGIIPAIVGWGYEPVLGLILGIIIGYSFFYFTINKIFSKKIKISIEYSTLVDLVPNNIKRIFRALQLLLYIGSIILELAAFRFILDSILIESEIITSFLLLLIVLLCATYIATGGYYGILKTDVFQIIIFSIGCLLAAYLTSNEFYSQIYNSDLLSGSLKIHDWWMFIGILIAVVVFHYGWPDIWVRNIGSLKDNFKNGLPSIKYGLIGLILFVLPAIIFSLSWK